MLVKYNNFQDSIYLTCSQFFHLRFLPHNTITLNYSNINFHEKISTSKFLAFQYLLQTIPKTIHFHALKKNYPFFLLISTSYLQGLCRNSGPNYANGRLIQVKVKHNLQKQAKITSGGLNIFSIFGHLTEAAKAASFPPYHRSGRWNL